MNLKNFKAGFYKKQLQYKSFMPVMINHTWTWDDAKLNMLLETATRKLGELNAFSYSVPNIDLFIQMHIIKEAHTSSKIEGTQTLIGEVVVDKKFIAPEKRDDWQEVQNYVKAMNYGIEQLEQMPLSSRLLKEMHAILLKGVRGEHKSPGNFRQSQNWVGGSSLSDAVYIPPHHEDMPALLSDFENFLHNDKIDVPHLVKIAIAHYQFETIHPFLDGNGRIGRLLITFYLVNNKLLKKPSLYISDFFERNRSSYYDALSRVRESNDMAHWVRFFLNAVIETSDKGVNTFLSILKLIEEVNAEIAKLGRRAESARKLINSLYSHPELRVNETAKRLSLPEKTVRDIVRHFEEIGLLKEYTGFKRNKSYMFDKYINLF